MEGEGEDSRGTNYMLREMRVFWVTTLTLNPRRLLPF